MNQNKIMDVLMYVLIFVAVLPTIAVTVAGGANLTGASATIFALIPIFVVWGGISYIRSQASTKK